MSASRAMVLRDQSKINTSAPKADAWPGRFVLISLRALDSAALRLRRCMPALTSLLLARGNAD